MLHGVYLCRVGKSLEAVASALLIGMDLLHPALVAVIAEWVEQVGSEAAIVVTVELAVQMEASYLPYTHCR